MLSIKRDMNNEFNESRYNEMKFVFDSQIWRGNRAAICEWMTRNAYETMKTNDENNFFVYVTTVNKRW